MRYLKQASEDESDDAVVRDRVSDIVTKVRADGDEALRTLTARFDDVDRERPTLTDEERDRALARLEEDERRIIDHNHERIRRFAERQLESVSAFETEFDEGVRMGHTLRPIQHIGAYVPGGRYPLLSSALMTITPPVVAGVDNVAVATPPAGDDGLPHAATVYAAEVAGADELFVAGGAQAIASLAYGTETVPAVDKIVGPGNAYTVEAKRQVYGDVGIDMLAGPSEVLVLADGTADPELVASDLLAQAEHDPNARPLLVTTETALGDDVIDEVATQLDTLSTADVAGAAWEDNGEVVVCDTIDEAVAVTNEYAPEHLEVHTEDPRSLFEDLHSYGSLFLGEQSAVVYSDKCVGTNHTLPTGGAARYTSGLSVFDCLRMPTHQELTERGAERMQKWTTTQSRLERLEGHARSAALRGEGATLDDHEEIDLSSGELP
jgi:histidinol dehydrogenase/sulfopropanediol 3-dehydrogenase